MFSGKCTCHLVNPDPSSQTLMKVNIRPTGCLMPVGQLEVQTAPGHAFCGDRQGLSRARFKGSVATPR